jgi:hypothetical protein
VAVSYVLVGGTYMEFMPTLGSLMACSVVLMNTLPLLQFPNDPVLFFVDDFCLIPLYYMFLIAGMFCYF